MAFKFFKWLYFDNGVLFPFDFGDVGAVDLTGLGKVL